jgi:hypothetical protein
MIHARKLRTSAGRSNKFLVPPPDDWLFVERGETTPCILVRAGESCFMTPMQQSVSNAGGEVSAVHLMMTEADVKLMAEDPERVMEEIWQRATQVGSVLENILQEPHGVPRWGLNE